MRLWRRAFVGLTSLALIANLVAWCPCAEAASRTAEDHGCCAPTAGWQAPSRDCCETKAPSPPVTSPEGPPVAAQSPAVALVPALVAAVSPFAAPTHPPLTPPIVLRI